MRFNCKEKRRYEKNDIRVLVKFAFFPKRIDHDTIIWLEQYMSYQVVSRIDWYTGPEFREYKCAPIDKHRHI